MAKPLLVIGNKNYSSWSLRAYMALAGADITFDEKLVRLSEPDFIKKVSKYSKAGLVPILQHNGITIWESLSILEYVAETWPKKNLWPKNKAARALARSMCSEMHAGFKHIRSACPMNLRRAIKPVPMNDGIKADVARIESLWAEARKLHGKGGPFLFGKFSLADAMYAPVVTRLNTYAIPVSKTTRTYMDAVIGSGAFQSWLKEALKEPWIVAEDEVD